MRPASNTSPENSRNVILFIGTSTRLSTLCYHISHSLINSAQIRSNPRRCSIDNPTTRTRTRSVFQNKCGSSWDRVESKWISRPQFCWTGRLRSLFPRKCPSRWAFSQIAIIALRSISTVGNPDLWVFDYSRIPESHWIHPIVGRCHSHPWLSSLHWSRFEGLQNPGTSTASRWGD